MKYDVLLPDRQMEQYWWTPETVDELVKLVDPYTSVACLGAPSLGLAIPQKATILDIDKRLARKKNFVYFDMKHPTHVGRYFDLIVADPPYSIVSGKELALIVSVMSGPDTKLLIVDNEEGRDYVSFFKYRMLCRLFEVRYIDLQPEPWYLWGDV